MKQLRLVALRHGKRNLLPIALWEGMILADFLRSSSYPFMLRVWPDPDPKIWWYGPPRSASQRYTLPGDDTADSVTPNQSGVGLVA